MAGNAAMRRAALRVLYEEWNVPVGLLMEVGSLRHSTLTRPIETEEWQRGHSAASLQAKMMRNFDKQITRFTKDIDDNPIDESVSRAFAVMVKTLETFATTSGKIASTHKLGEQKKQETHLEQIASANTAEQRSNLDKQLADLLEGVKG